MRRKAAFFILLAACLPWVIWAALPATDAFTGSNGTNLATHSASWTIESIGATTSFQIQSNAVAPSWTGARVLIAYWNADSFANDQYSQGVVSALSGADYPGLCVRCSDANGYTIIWDTTTIYLRKIVANVETQITTTSVALSTSDVMRLEVSGTSISVKRNGSVITALNTTDSALSTGSAGIAGYGGTPGRLDDWQGGNLTTASKKKAVVTQ